MGGRPWTRLFRAGSRSVPAIAAAVAVVLLLVACLSTPADAAPPVHEPCAVAKAGEVQPPHVTPPALLAVPADAEERLHGPSPSGFAAIELTSAPLPTVVPSELAPRAPPTQS